MKKIFVLFICFCILFSQSAFGLDEHVSNNFDNTKIEKDTLKDTPRGANEQNDKSDDVEIEENSKEDNNIEKSGDVVTNVDSAVTENDDTVTDVKSDNVQNDDKKIDTKPGTEHCSVTTDDTKLKESSKKEFASIPKSILITEVLLDTSSSTSKYHEEYIELYNTTHKDIKLDGYSLKRNTTRFSENCINSLKKDKNLIASYAFKNIVIHAHDYLIITNKDNPQTNWPNSMTFSSKSATITKTSTILLYDNAHNIVDQVGFGDACLFEKSPIQNPQKNESIERKLDGDTFIDTDNNADDFKINPCPFPGDYLPTNLSSNIRINEIYSNTCSDCENEEEFIELYNPDKISLKGWKLTDSSTISGNIENATTNDYSLVILTKKDFKFTLNDSGDTISLIAPNCSVVSSVSYSKSYKGSSFNYANNWYWETPTPGAKNIPNPLTKEYPQIYINELLPNPGSNDEEFIEIYNPTDEVVSLKNWVLKDASKTGKFTFRQQVVQPKSFLMIYKEEFKFALNNSGGETVSLIAPNNKTISSVFYTDTKRGLSLNRAKNWYFAESSPGKKNNENPKTKAYPQLLLSEVLPNPIGDENTDEFIEIYNPNNFDIDLKYWTIKDASKTGEYTFTTNLFIKANSYFTIYRNDFKFALNNGDESVSLIAPNDKITSTVTYTGAKEGVSYNYSQTDKNWRWSKHLTPNKPNIFNNLPIITKFDIDKKIYKDVYAEFSTKASDLDGEKLKVRWDFGDGHKSYLWKTRHKYQKTGIYQASLRVQDGSEEVIKKFEVVVKKYPQYDIVITKVLPNPSGKDTGVEYIVIKNESKKNINLKDWSVATGTSKKTLVNHPITKKLIIKKGKTKIINKKYASITLPNKTGTVELRRPNKSVSDKLTYGDKNVSIPENAIYEKINKKWKWIVPIDPSKQAQTQEIIAQALKNEQIFSQQKLESLIAYEAIHNPPKEYKTEILDNKSLLESIVKYINSLLNKTIIVYNDFKKNISTKKEIAINAPIYKIPDNKNPCTQPTLYNFDNLHICE